MSEHYSYLEGDHGLPNMHLQQAWNNYGADAFVFFVLEYCDHAVCHEREAAWMLAYTNRGDELYNKAAAVRHPGLGMKRSDEQRARMSAAQLLASADGTRAAKISATMKGIDPCTPEQQIRRAEGVRAAVAKSITLSNGMHFATRNEFALACGYAGGHSLVYQLDTLGRTPDDIARKRGLI